MKIFYEVVDLGQQDANGLGGSPIAFRDSKGSPVYVHSERYVLLQTYVFKNLSSTDVNNIEFYQMLHGHPTGNWVMNTKCMYEAADFNDPLADYIPCDSNHHTGNFRYDVSMWNCVPPAGQPDHFDWMGFSSTIEPDWVDCGVFDGHSSDEPTTGTHVRIKNRSLNGQTSITGEQLAGAMGWQLGNLAPGQTKSITLALMYGLWPMIHTTPPWPDGIVYVDEDANGLNNGSSWQNAYKELRDAIDDIAFGNRIYADQIWVAKGIYKPTDNPGETAATFAMLDGIDMYGHFNGNETSIDQRNLADANNAAILTGYINGDGNGDLYTVVTAADARLDGFTIKGCRNSDTGGGVYCNGTNTTIANCILTDNDYHGLKCTTCDSNSYISLVNCFVEDNDQRGIYCIREGGTIYLDIDRCTINSNNAEGLYISGTPVEVNITDSIISENGNQFGNGDGVYSIDNKLTIERCDITDNNGVGISTHKNNSNPQVVVKNSIISGNNSYGLYSESSQTHIANNLIFDNSEDGIQIQVYADANVINNLIYNNGGYGIYLYTNNPFLEIRNNTIVGNGNHGIRKDYGNDPNISSNIIWGNTSGGLNGISSRVNFNCIQVGYTGSGIHNIINQNPQFRDTYYHLADISPCIDKGDPNFNSSTETDIDGENRIMRGCVDMGADEFYFSPADIYPDDIVNFLDFAVFAKPWMTSQSDANYNNICDLYDDNVIDYKDLYIFCADWLWQKGQGPGGMMGIGGQGAYFADNSGGGEMMIAMQPEQELVPAPSEPVLSEIEETEGSEQPQPEQEADVNQMMTESQEDLSGSDEMMTAMQPEQEFLPESLSIPEQSQLEQEADVNELVNWLDELWQTNEEIRESIDANSWEEFLESVKPSE